MATEEAPGGDGLHFCLVGYGRWGQTWAKLLNSRSMLSHVVETDKNMRAKASLDFPHVVVCEEVPDWDFGVIDGAVVATPPGAHMIPTLKLLSGDVPVIVEKPMAPTRADAVKMMELAEARNVRLMVDHTFLGSESVLAAMRYVHEQCGKVRHARFVWTNERTASPEGALWNLGPHPVSIAMRLASMSGTDLRGFSAQGIETCRPHAVDTCGVTLYMKDDSVYQLHLTNFGAEKVREFAVVGKKGAVVCRPTQREVVFRQHDWPAERFEVDNHYGKAQPLENVLRAFLDPEPMNDQFGREGVACVELLEKITNTWQVLERS